MSNKSRNVLYIGVTNDLLRRVSEHKNRIVDGFTKKYNCEYLVYYEYFEKIDQAIEREKRLKKWNREWKFQLIKSMNPNLEDLSDKVEYY
jgi:putative endonuclease